MRFANVEGLQFLWVIVGGIVLYFWYQRRKAKMKTLLGELPLIQTITSSHSSKKERIKFYTFVLSLIFITLAFARPQWGKKAVKVKHKSLDIVLILDLSKSMLAQDILPSRLEFAKMEIKEFIKKLKTDRIGIVGFAGEAFVFLPLTLDYEVGEMVLEGMDVTSISSPGTKIGEAIMKAKNLLVRGKAKPNYSICILLTDGEDLGSDYLKAIEEAKKVGMKIYTVGIGTPEGEPIPERNEEGKLIGYKKDEKGEIVMSKLNEEVLTKIAIETGGGYVRGGLDLIYHKLKKFKRREVEEGMGIRYEEKFVFPLLIGVGFLLLSMIISDRKKK